MGANAHSLLKGERGTRESVHKLGLAAGIVGSVLYLILGCKMPLPLTGEEMNARAAAGAKAITAFSFDGLSATGTIDQGARTIAFTAPYATDVTALVATFTTTGKRSCSTAQVSGTTRTTSARRSSTA